MAEKEEEVLPLPKAMNFSERVKALGYGEAKESLTVSPNNGVSQICGTGMIQFEIPGNQLAKYCDFSSLYIACDITNSDGTTNNFSHIGTMGLVNRIIVTTNTNKQFCDITCKNQLDAIMIAKQGDNNWLSSTASVLFGCGSSAVAGYPLAANEVKRFLIPIHLIGLDVEMFPLMSQENLRFQIYLESAATVFKAATTGITNAQITLSNILLHYDTVQLKPEEDAKLIKEFRGALVLNVPCWQQQDTTITAANTTSSMNLGFSKKRAKRLLVSQRNSTFIANDAVCSFAMDFGEATEISLKLNGKEVKTQTYVLSNGAPELLAEAIKSNCGRILDIHPSNTNIYNYDVAQDAAGTGDNNCGRAYIEFDLQNGLQNDSDTITSGISVVNGNFTLGFKRAATDHDRYVNAYLEYWVSFVLDVQTRTWTVWE